MMMTIALLCLIAAAVADVVTTLGAFERGAVEANPLLAFVMARLGRGWIALKLAVTCVAGAMLAAWGAPIAVFAAAAAIAAVAWSNTRVRR